MKCVWCRVVELNGKNRRTLDIIDIDTKKKVTWLICADCHGKIMEMKRQKDAELGLSEDAQGQPVVS